MAAQRPSLPELIDQGAAEFESRLPGVLPRLRNSVIGVINRVLAGALSALYQYAEWMNRQAWPDVAEAEFLDGHGARWGVLRTPAAGASGSVTFTGANGALVPLGTVVQRADGLQYSSRAAGVVAAGTLVLAVRASGAVLAGQLTNALLGTALQLVTPIAGVNAAASAATALAGGADAEADAPYRARIMARIQQVPQGGSQRDYEAWVRAVPGVTRAWVYPLEQGPGTVVLRFMREDDLTGAVPDAGEVAAVQAQIDLLRPVTAVAYVVAPEPLLLNLTIQMTPISAAVRAAVAAELAELLRREAVPGGTLLLSHIRETVSTSAGEVDHSIVLPAANVVAGTGQILQLGVITWQ